MKKTVHLVVLLAFMLMALFAGSTLLTPTPVSAADAIWRDVAERQIPSSGIRQIIPLAYRTVRLDMNALRAQLATAPWELTEAAKNAPLIIELPEPDGTMGRFQVEEYRMMEPGLAAQFPDWHTYHAQGVDDPTAIARISLTAQGFHGMVLGGVKGTYYIDPYQQGDSTNYISYFKSDFRNTRPDTGPDQLLIDEEAQTWLDSLDETERPPTNGILRTYRLANAATGEYCTFHGGTVAGCQAAIVVAINRVNGVYEKDVNIRMILVANNTSVVYTNGGTDPYTNNSGTTMLGQNQTNLDAVIGTANYDIGHVFSTGGGGVASLGVPCRAGVKARGVTGQGSPVGDPFYIDYVAHEMGHQWGANHTFNGTASSCGGGNRSASSAYEPGSGITIMAYAGICGAENLAQNSIDTFVTRSYDEIRAYITTAGTGDSCDVPINTGNDAPVVNAGADYTIPAQTPFELEGSATDSTPAGLTYDWQQYNIGTATSAANTNTDLGNNPIFRPWLPEADGTRVFPDLTYILNNANVPPNPVGCPAIPGQPAPSQNCSPGMTLPTTNRTLVFRLMVRDNVANAGGVDYDSMNATVVNTAGPFQVTSNNTAGGSYPGGSTQTVTWNVANTTASPISCANVNVLLSTDGGNTFPTTVGTNLTNNGSGSVTLPNVATTTARWKVKCANNIFFDINNANFTITAGGPTSTPTNTATNTAVPPTNTPTNTPSNTPVPPTSTPTATNTSVPPTNTATSTGVPPTNTPTLTNTPVPPTPTATSQVPTLTVTPTSTRIPDINVTPNAFVETHSVSPQTTTDTMNIQNTATGALNMLNWAITEDTSTGRPWSNPNPVQPRDPNAPVQRIGLAGGNSVSLLELGPIVGDGSFETGTPNAEWDEFSANFGTPLCDAVCGTGGGTGPRTGAWWSWFGGTTAAETGILTQTVTIPSGSAELTFWLEIPPTATGTNGFLSVRMDGTELFRAEETTTGYATYAEVTVDVSAYANGASHQLVFFSATDAGAAVTNFFVDDIAITVEAGLCDAPTDISWLSVSPTNGTTTGSSSTPVTLTYNSASLAQGTYTATLCIVSNDPDEPLVTVPVTLIVEQSPTAIDLNTFGTLLPTVPVADIAIAGFLLLAGTALIFRRRKS
jgi:hypothetical protein